MELNSFIRNDYSSYMATQHPYLIIGETVLLSLMISLSPLVFLPLVTVILVFLHFLSGSRTGEVFSIVISFWPLYFFIALAPFLSNQNISNAVYESVSGVYRFSHYILVGMVVGISLAPERVQRVTYDICRWIPFINEKRIASVIRIVFSLIPQLTDVMKHMKDSRKSRCFGKSGKKIHMISSQGYSLAAYFLIRAVRYSDALESRLFTVERIPEGGYPFRKRDILLFVSLTAIFITLMTINRIYPDGQYFFRKIMNSLYFISRIRLIVSIV